jgi:hypothetical protein
MLALLQSNSAQEAYKKAAIAYAIYGIVYMLGAILELNDARMKVFWGFVPWWAFYIVGTALMFSMPFLIYRKMRWISGFLAVGVSGKTLYLIYSQGRHVTQGDKTDPYNWFFALVALITTAFLLFAIRWPTGTTEEESL